MPTIQDENFHKLGVPVDVQNVHPELTKIVQDALARMFGFNSIDKTWQPILVDPDGNIGINQSLGASETFAPSRVAISGVAATVVAANSDRKQLWLNLTSAITMFLSSQSGVTALTGWSITGPVTIQLNEYVGALYCITGGSAATLYVAEVY